MHPRLAKLIADILYVPLYPFGRILLAIDQHLAIQHAAKTLERWRIEDAQRKTDEQAPGQEL
jgi:hypothetical protein